MSLGTTPVLLCTNWNGDTEVSPRGGNWLCTAGNEPGTGTTRPTFQPQDGHRQDGAGGDTGGFLWCWPWPLPKSWAGRAGSAGQGCLEDHRTSRSRSGEQKVSAVLLIPATERFLVPSNLVRQLELHNPGEKWNWDVDVVWGSGPTQTWSKAQQSHNTLLSKLE